MRNLCWVCTRSIRSRPWTNLTFHIGLAEASSIFMISQRSSKKLFKMILFNMIDLLWICSWKMRKNLHQNNFNIRFFKTCWKQDQSQKSTRQVTSLRNLVMSRDFQEVSLICTINPCSQKNPLMLRSLMLDPWWIFMNKVKWLKMINLNIKTWAEAYLIFMRNRPLKIRQLRVKVL